MIEYEEALAYIIQQKFTPEIIEVDLAQANNHILAQEIKADRDYPPFNRATMDGFALKSTNYKPQKYQVKDVIYAGESKEIELDDNQCIKIMTGAPVPKSCDAVVKIEETADETNDSVIINSEQVASALNIAIAGEDVKAGESVLKIGSRISMINSGTLASLGCAKVKVFKQPKTIIFSSGDEIVEVAQQPKPYQIRNSNKYSLASVLAQYNIVPEKIVHLPDDKDAIRRELVGLDEYDLILFSGAVSAGDKDYLPEILLEKGAQKIFHKAKIKPGKPIWFGKMVSGATIFGFPGNPISCMVLAKVFLEEWIRASYSMPKLFWFKMPLASARTKRGQREDFFPVEIISNEQSYISAKRYNGSGDIRGFSQSSGLARHPAHKTEILKDEQIYFLPWSEL